MVGVCVIIEVYTVLGAPLGYQDEKGFHVGAKSADCGNDRLGSSLG
jgi:hypothetical protein